VDVAKTERLWACTGRVPRLKADSYKRCSQWCWGAGESAEAFGGDGGSSGGAWNNVPRESETKYADIDVTPSHRLLYRWLPCSSYIPTMPPQTFKQNAYGSDLDIFPILPDDIASPNPVENYCSIFSKSNWPTAVVGYRAPYGVRSLSDPSSPCCAGWCDSLSPFPSLYDGRLDCYVNSDDQLGLVTMRAVLKIDMQGLLSCAHQASLSGQPLLDDVPLNDDSDNGLVIYATIRGPRSEASQNDYTVLLGHAQRLQAVEPDASKVRGLTLASDQAVFIAGNYNVPIDKSESVAAAIVSDTVSILSEASCWNLWSSTPSLCNSSVPSWVSYPRTFSGFSNTNPFRIAADTAVRTALLVGSDTAGGSEGTGGQNRVFEKANYGSMPWASGGVMNVIRFLENWNQKTFSYTGSVVSLWKPQHNQAPDRIWAWDEAFSTPEGLPPLTPLLNYTQQQVYERTYSK
jgi:hypothetical protein